MTTKPLFIFSLYLIPLTSIPATACDSCPVYAAVGAQEISHSGWFTALAGQYTRFGTTQLEGHEVPNEADQHLDSTITQAVAGYQFTPRTSVQLNLPYIHRSYKRPEGFATDRGTEQGIGDVSLTGHFRILRQDKPDNTLMWDALAGIKLPTGSSSRIKEEIHEIEVEGAPESGIHGHDLALGSGSFDGVIGTAAYYRYQRMFATASVQYSLRAEGDYDYRYANHLTWEAGVGAYLMMENEGTLALELLLSGENKRKDQFEGETAADTAINIVYLGPKIVGSWGDNLSADLGVDIPISIGNSAFQTVADFRVRGGVTWSF